MLDWQTVHDHAIRANPPSQVDEAFAEFRNHLITRRTTGPKPPVDTLGYAPAVTSVSITPKPSSSPKPAVSKPGICSRDTPAASAVAPPQTMLRTQ